MARCNEAIPLSPINNASRCATQYASSGSITNAGTISPIISVSSVNGESGDIVLKNLVIGNKVYNGSNEIHVYANDLGLEKAVIYRGRYLTKDSMATALAEAEVGDLFFCAEDKLFYLSVGEGDYKCFVSDRALKDFYNADVPAKVEMELEGDDYKLVTKLFNKDNKLLCESYPIELPYEIKDIIKEGYYDKDTNEIVFVLNNDKEIRVSLSGIVNEFQPKITEDNKLSMALVEGLPSFTTNITARVANEERLRAAGDEEEAADRQAADEEEKAARKLVDGQLSDRIDEEAKIRKEADDKITAALDTETHKREVKDIALEGRLDTVESTLLEIGGDLISEALTRENADNNLSERIDVEITNRSEKDTELMASIQAEKNARKLVDGQLSDRIDKEATDREAIDTLISTDLEHEKIRATTIEKSLDGRIHALDSEFHTTTADLKTALATERTERSLVDGQLATRIDNERAWAESEVARLDSEIEAEAGTRALIDGQLSDAIGDEAEIRAAKDNELHEEIMALPRYEVREVGETPEYIKVYKLYEVYPSGAELEKGDINIPKDFLVKSAKVYTVTEADKLPGGKFYNNDEFLVGDKYIDFTINVHVGEKVTEEHLYLNVKSLVDVYTGGRGININSQNVVEINDEVYNLVINTAAELSQEKLTREQDDEEIRHNISLVDGVLVAHKADYNNPHQVTKAQVGLGNVDNTADIDKPISTAVAKALSDEVNRATESEIEIRDTLNAKIEKEITDRTVDVDAEETSRKEADIQLGKSISDLTLIVNNEIRDRISQCNNLQEQINNITSRRTSYAETIIGDGVADKFQIFHELGTMDVIVQVFDVTNGQQVIVANRRYNDDMLELAFRNAPAENATYRVLCQSIDSDVEIRYYPNGGSGEMPITIAVKGKPVALRECGFEAPEGYEFKSWAINSPEGVQVTPPEPYAFDVDSEVYAIWEPIKGSENVHFGKVKDDVIPTSIDGLSGTYIAREILLSDGFTVKATTDEERIVVAIKKSLNIELEDIKYEAGGEEWHLGFKSSETAEDIIYYDEDGSTSGDFEWNFVYTFKEA